MYAGKWLVERFWLINPAPLRLGKLVVLSKKNPGKS